MKLLIKCSDNWLKTLYENHKHQYDNDAGLDVFCPESLKITGGKPALLNLGIQCYNPEKKPYLLMPRSSIMKKGGLVQLNSVGLIDPQYTGTIKAPVMLIENPYYVFSWYLTVVLVIIALSVIITNKILYYALCIACAVLSQIITLRSSCTIHPGEALFQLVAFDGERIDFELVDELPKTDRGEQGFGSTTDQGKKDL